MSLEATAVGIAEESVGQGSLSGEPGRPVRERLRGSIRLKVGVFIVAFFVLLAIFGPLFVGSPNAYGPAILQPPSLQHLLGTTQIGQDVLAQVVVGARGTLEVGFFAAAIATVVSIVFGIGGGYVGGRVDEVLALVSNIFLVIPTLPLVILVSAYVRSKSEIPLILVIAATSWAASARVLRAQTLSVRQREYVLAARASGERTWRVMLVEIVPNELAIIASQMLFGVIFAILTQAGLAFLGLGNVNSTTWGSVLHFAQSGDALSLGAWWWFVPPGLCIAVLGAGLALINFGLDEIVNPRLRVVRSKAR